MTHTAILTTVHVVDPPIISTLPYTSPFMYTDSSDSATSERPPSQPNKVCKMLIARKRVRALPVGLLASMYSLDISSGHSIQDSPFDNLGATSVGPSRKRFRIRGSISTTDYEVSSEESYEPCTEPDIDFDVQAGIDAYVVAADAETTRETDVRVDDGIENKAEAGIERVRADTLQRRLGYEEDELRQAYEICAYESQRLWRMEIFMMRT
nr:hypothetical protein [Tanacetum cinerariifolium]